MISLLHVERAEGLLDVVGLAERVGDHVVEDEELAVLEGVGHVLELALVQRVVQDLVRHYSDEFLSLVHLPLSEWLRELSENVVFYLFVAELPSGFFLFFDEPLLLSFAQCLVEAYILGFLGIFKLFKAYIRFGEFEPIETCPYCQ